jgi:DMSO reductase anchor subunit
MSLVLLTALSGIGQGLFILLAILDLLFWDTLPKDFVYISSVISLVLPGLGVLASTFHLGNPQRGIKAFKKLGSSWLSREMFFTTLFLVLVFMYGVVVYINGEGSLRRVIGMLGIFTSLALYLSSSMLYVKIRFVREWSNPFTVINFLLLGLTSGLLAGIAALAYTGSDPVIVEPVTSLFLWLGFASLLFKVATYHFNANHYQPFNEKNALSIFGKDIKLTDMGTTYIHFNTKEYFYPLTDSQLLYQRTAVIFFAFLIPLALIYTMTGSSAVFPLIAFAVMTAGIIIERRLFFIEGTHIQNLYYGNFRKNRKANPIVSLNR